MRPAPPPKTRIFPEFPHLGFALCLPLLVGYVMDSRKDCLVLAERHPAHPARIPAPGFRLMCVFCSPLWIGYVIEPMMVTGFWFLAQKAKMGETFVAFLRLRWS